MQSGAHGVTARNRGRIGAVVLILSGALGLAGCVRCSGPPEGLVDTQQRRDQAEREHRQRERERGNAQDGGAGLSADAE